MKATKPRRPSSPRQLDFNSALPTAQQLWPRNERGDVPTPALPQVPWKNKDLCVTVVPGWLAGAIIHRTATAGLFQTGLQEWEVLGFL